MSAAAHDAGMTPAAVTAGTPLALAGVRHWRLARGADELLWLGLDCADADTNTLASAVLLEFGQVLDRIATERPRGLVLYSPKTNGFAAGADVREFDGWTDAAEIAAKIGEVHALFARLESLPFASVARLHGFCLGGGLELALACRHQVAADDAATRLGFPEVLLGIHPGFGGSVRSIRNCGAPVALELMLSGRSLDARRAQQAGLVTRAVPLRHLDAAAVHFATHAAPRRRLPLPARLAQFAPVRPLLANHMRRTVAKRAAEAHYPAPYAVIRLWEAHGADPGGMYAAEARSIGALLTSATSRNLVRLFKLQERVKALGRGGDWQARRVHVIGAGTMGGDIAAWCALRGMQVTLQDRAPEFIAPAIKRAHALFERRLRDKYARAAALDRLVPDFSGDGLARADVVIEAIVENVEAKRALFRDVETRARPDALLATNTSSIQLDDIALALAVPGRLVGIHFFNPVAQMQLVEIVCSPATAAEAQARAQAFTVALDRLPLPVASAPGFLVNRVLSPYLQEAMSMLEEGVAARDIDAVAERFGMPMGPLALADTVGLDICLHVGEILSGAFGGEVPAILRQKVADGRLGRKRQAGFYEYDGKRVIALPGRGTQLDALEIRDRMLLRMLNEAVACLREGIVSDADLVDLGMVFGTGFAPFRGGPLAYARARGVDEITARLTAFATRYGPRFVPDPAWSSLGDG